MNLSEYILHFVVCYKNFFLDNSFIYFLLFSSEVCLKLITKFVLNSQTRKRANKKVLNNACITEPSLLKIIFTGSQYLKIDITSYVKYSHETH